MRAVINRVRVCGAVAAGLFGLLQFGWLGIGEAPAAVPDACGLTTEARIAGEFGLGRAVIKTAVPAPLGNPSGALRTRCRAFAWAGGRPVSDRRKREALVGGRLGLLEVDTWVADQSPYAASWRMRFDAKLNDLRRDSVELFVKRLNGRAFVPARLGAEEAIAYRGTTARTARARGLWWKRSDDSLIGIEVEVARDRPAAAILARIARTLALGFNTGCTYPCGPAAG